MLLVPVADIKVYFGYHFIFITVDTSVRIASISTRIRNKITVNTLSILVSVLLSVSVLVSSGSTMSTLVSASLLESVIISSPTLLLTLTLTSILVSTELATLTLTLLAGPESISLSISALESLLKCFSAAPITGILLSRVPSFITFANIVSSDEYIRMHTYRNKNKAIKTKPNPTDKTTGKVKDTNKCLRYREDRLLRNRKHKKAVLYQSKLMCQIWLPQENVLYLAS
uniref:Uncharacterized protein n=1 Tax=Glossina austeni TaxID=7395 RepID=A0A1A9VQV2_GLOAU